MTRRAAAPSTRAAAAVRAPASPARGAVAPSISICPLQLPAASTTASPCSDAAIGLDDELVAGARRCGARGRARSSCAPWRRAAATSARVSSAAATKPCAGNQQAAERRRRTSCGSWRARAGASSSSRADAALREQRVRGCVKRAQRLGVAARRRACRCAGSRSSTPLSAATRATNSSKSSRLRAVELEQRPAVARLDVRRQHAGRRLRRAHARPADRRRSRPTRRAAPARTPPRSRRCRRRRPRCRSETPRRNLTLRSIGACLAQLRGRSTPCQPCGNCSSPTARRSPSAASGPPPSSACAPSRSTATKIASRCIGSRPTKRS